jgi:hypothetical protein
VSFFPAFAKLARHMFKDHLEGGEHASLDPKDPKFASVPKSNKYAECVFGLLDHLVTRKPNISTLASEAYIMYSQNRTSAWLKEQDAQTLDALVKEARKSRGKLQQKFRERKKDIEERKRQQVAKRIQGREKAEKKKVVEKEQISCKMIEFGLWQTETEVVEQVASYRFVNEKLAALKAQLRFRQKVLEQKTDDPRV